MTGGLGLCLLLAATGCATPSQDGGGEVDEAEELPDEITMVIPYPEAGGSDTWGRFFVQHLGDALEGGPSVTPENREGGEAITGTNQFVRDDATDGSEVLVSSATQTIQQMLGRPEVEYDFTEMRPVIINASGGVIFGSVDEGVEDIEDLTNGDADLSYGGISPAGLDLVSLLAFEVLDLDVDVSLGFEGRADALAALQRGEVSLDYQTTSAYLAQVEPMVEDGDVVPLMSYGQLDDDGEVVRDPVVEDLPHVGEVYEEIHGEEPSGPDWDAYAAFLAAGATYQKGLWVPADTPDAVVDAYTDAVNTLREDEDFLTEGEEVLGGYEVLPGAENEAQIHGAFELDPGVEDWVLTFLEEEYDTSIDGS
jgi:tripartite-type tricarboxylate transporter receptor subunit TctC